MSDRRIILTLRLILVFLGILLAAESYFLSPNIRPPTPSISIPVIVIPTNEPQNDSGWSSDYDYNGGWNDESNGWEDPDEEWTDEGSWDDDSGDSGSW